ncbi:selenocysteine lyase [Candidatus Endobugula sertula]|uniref:Selenocysteine lyase n=1 Tax=Candidatus Endobugula sertula TaxID=62101 RepID=A0A1D2QSW3_9GAMM|nr:selenocysteine lyase [Candidatus Endobugula sertula]
MNNYFSKFREGIIGYNHSIKTPLHRSTRLIYADWIASGRMFSPIEEKMAQEFLPYVANTHTETNFTGSFMTFAYAKARQAIKDHVNAKEDDVLISSGSGMTDVVNKLQRILGLKVHESFKNSVNPEEKERPVVFVTHMEHHSNHTSWFETIAEVIVVPSDNEGLVCIDKFRKAIEQYQHRKIKIAAVTACSNVTGIITPYMEIAKIVHEFNGLCFVDFACSAPYVDIDMHEDDSEGKYLDAIYFSPHKFLGGPGTTGILIFNKKIYANNTPDHPGGGTVDWTNPWGVHKYIDDVYLREDGGTPAFLQTIRVALCIRLKEEMGVSNIQKREQEILNIIWEDLELIPNIHILAGQHKNRLGVVSFNINGLYYNLGVKILNDRFGIQTRGGCACAGTYGHYLLNINEESSDDILNMITVKNDFSQKPGWIRLSIHPTHTDEEIRFITHAIKQLAENHQEWSNDYNLDLKRESIKPKKMTSTYEINSKINKLFEEDLVNHGMINNI